MKALIASLMFVCTSAHAIYENGNMVLRDLEGTEMGKMYALGYIVGVADAFNDDELLCIHPSVTKGQLSDVVHIYLKNNPQVRNLPATVLIMIALSDHWACPSKPKRRSKS
jgi:hypothetical protein